MHGEGILGRRLRMWIAGLLIAAAVIPIAARQRTRWNRDAESSYKETEFKWTWDVLEVFSEKRVKGPELALAFFFLVTPLLGLAALFMEKTRNRAGRGVWFIVLGSLPLLLLLIMTSQVTQGLGLGQNVLGFAISALMLGGLLGALMRPGHDLGYQVAGWAGVASVVSMLLPMAPDLQNPRDKTLPILNLVHSLEVPKIGFVIFAVALLGLLAALFAASLLMKNAGRPGRARTSIGLVLAGLGAAFLLPFLLYFMAGGDAPFLPMLTLTVSILAVRVLPAMGMLAYGVGETLVVRMGADAPQEAPRSFRDHCDAILAAHRRFARGEFDAETFRKRKIRLLKAAVTSAREERAPQALLRELAALQQEGAVNDVEIQSVRRALG